MNAAIGLASMASACVLSAAATPALRRLALRWNLSDRPGGHKAHDHPTPYLGGPAIVLGTVVPTAAALGLADLRITAIVLAATAIAALGLIDDIASLPVVTRLTVESVAAGGVVLSGVHVTVTGQWVDGLITVMWIVVMTNSFNLLDNMDGALGTVTAVTAAFLAAAALMSDRPAFAVLLGALALSCLGFLAHNWPPARIFMGDSGSLFIGFTLTCSSVAVETGRAAGTTAAGLLLWTFVAVVDTGVVLVSRIRAGRSPLSGGTDHLSHRLRRMGLGSRAVPAALGAVAAVPGALCLAIAVGWVPALAAAIVTGGVATLLIGLLQGVPAYAPAGPVDNLAKITERRR
ncbi:MraY family glycosyltransferase [Sphaerisporangium sp. NPDC005289]|uniref:glycosyltransferase family 4 protein n=1 Tax=Sphaerisporangium sp. NPDC005289 TaxID=3155247 RepID=UPI00339EC8D3